MLAALFKTLDGPTLRRLNAQIALEGQDARKVAESYLKSLEAKVVAEEKTFMTETWSTKVLAITAAVAFVLGLIVAHI